VVVANKMYSTMVTCLSEELTRIGLALRHLAPVEGIIPIPMTDNEKIMPFFHYLLFILTKQYRGNTPRSSQTDSSAPQYIARTSSQEVMQSIKAHKITF
jgi:hypothetical protein